jgi:hypothetical protein
MLSSFIAYIYNALFTVEDDGLSSRMEKNVSTFNGRRIHPYKPFVVSINARKLLKDLKKKTPIEDKVLQMNNHYQMMSQIAKGLYDYFDPTFIYYFNNEIHLVFYYDDNKYIFNGNVNKLLTSISSYATMMATKVNPLNDDAFFTGTYIEFNKDYETFNYIIWRQFDCYRNTMSVLHRCVSDEDISYKSIDEIVGDMDDYVIPDTLKFGITMKKQLQLKPCETDLANLKKRRRYQTFSMNLSTDFKKNIDRLLFKKLL